MLPHNQAHNKPVAVYGFREQLEQGQRGEAILDRYFARWYTIEHLDLGTEMNVCADRLFIAQDGHQTLVEYKTDYKAHETGNVIVEMESSNNAHTDGWAVKSQAEMLIVYVYHAQRALVIPMYEIRANLERWNECYRKVLIRNAKYATVGILVPIWEYEQIAIQDYGDVGKEIASD